MESDLGTNADKLRILNDVARCIKSVYVEATSSNHALTTNLTVSSPLVLSLDRALQHGLLNLVHGYWVLVRGYSHAQTLHVIDAWASPQASPRVKGQVWLLSTLVEGSLQSYLQCIVADSRTISRLYAPHALLRDCACVLQLTSLLAGLQNITFIMFKNSDSSMDTFVQQPVEEPTYSVVKIPLDLHLDGISKNNLMTSSTTTMTSSMTSSLASPGDSGFTQLDSETDTASINEVALEPDSSSMREECTVLPDDSDMHSGCNTSLSCLEATVIGDITNGNASVNTACATKFTKGEKVTTMHDIHKNFNFQTDCDEIVYRRQKSSKGKTYSCKQQKRVSFHEERIPVDESFVCPPKASTVSCTASPMSASTYCITPATSNLSANQTLSSGQEEVEIGTELLVYNEEGNSISRCSTPNMENSRINQTSTPIPNKVQKSNSDSLSASSIISAVKTFITGTPCSQNDMRALANSPKPVKGSVYHQSMVSSPQVGFDVTSSSAASEKSSDSEQSVDAAERLRDGAISPVPSCSSLRPQVSTPRRTLSRVSSSFRQGSSSAHSSVLSQPPSKGCLVNRFLRSITEKKLSSSRASAALAAAHINRPVARKSNLYIRGVKPIDELSQEILTELDEEIRGAGPVKSDSRQHSNSLVVDLTLKLDQLLRANLLSSQREVVYKVVRVQSSSVKDSGARKALLFIVTDRALYISDLNFIKEKTLFLTHLNSILMGPNSQWIALIDSDGSLHYSIVVGEQESAFVLVSSIELAVRRNRIASRQLPAVKRLLVEDLSILPTWTFLLQGEAVDYYSVVHALEESASPPSTPLGPTKKGHFMFRVSNDSTCSWEPGYFVLKAGVLYHFSGDDEILPHYVLVLNGVHCCRSNLTSRPHTIEVGFLQLAAPDDYVASDWLQALQRASSGVYESAVGEHRTSIRSGSLVLTESRLLLLNTLGIPFEISNKHEHPLQVGYISDVASLRVGDSGCRWCVMELACREACESGGDYILFFNSSHEMASFRDKLWSLCPSLVENTNVLNHADVLWRRCERIDKELLPDWDAALFLEEEDCS